MKKNQVENQVENQDDNQVDYFYENNLLADNENIVCNIYKEQFDLINELPLEERLKVLYIAVSKAFYEVEKNQVENQVENQVDYTYISSSISIYNSLSNYSKVLIQLLLKTINCKNYKNWGGKRKNSGRRKGQKITDDNIECYGEHLNVALVKGDYEKLLAVTQSKELLNEVIEDLGTAIRTGKEQPYKSDLPFAHYERLRAYIKYRKEHPMQVKGGTSLERKYNAIQKCFNGG